MSIQDHTTTFDGKTLDGQDFATQTLFFGTWGNWARVRWVLEYDHSQGQSDPVPVVDPADARSGNLPGGIPCAGGSQCASGVCSSPTFLCASALVDKSKIDPKLQNPGTTTTSKPADQNANPSKPQLQQPFDLGVWFSSTSIARSVLGAQAPQISNGMLAAVGGLLLLMSGKHHRGGLL